MVNQIDQTFTALADPTRRRVVELLRDRPLRASEIASAVDMSRPATGRHLRVLRSSNLVEVVAFDEDGRGRVYRLRAEPFSDLQKWLSDVQSFWTDQLVAFKDHVERTRSDR